MIIPTSRKQYITFVVGVVVALLFLLIVSSVISAFLVDESEIANDEAMQAAQGIIEEVTIPTDFLRNGPLQDFAPYSPLQPPAEAGRENPFAPAPAQSEPQP